MRGLIYFPRDFGKKSGYQVRDRGFLAQVLIVRCVDNVNTPDVNRVMSDPSSTAEVNIHLRARSQDRMLIDQAAELVGTNRSQFMMASALKEAKNILLDQSTIFADAETFQKVMDWMDGPATPAEAEGMTRLLKARAPWDRG